MSTRPTASLNAAGRGGEDANAWLQRLSSPGPERDAAIAELHELLLRAATFEVNRRRTMSAQLRGGDLDDLAHQSADDALVAVLAKLDQFRGESRFETWAYKFALYEAGAKMRRRTWHGREIPLSAEAWRLVADGRPAPHHDVETAELLGALSEEIERSLSPRQREVLLALAVAEVPIDVLAERLDTTRGALYKTLHDARRKLRRALAIRGLSVREEGDRR